MENVSVHGGFSIAAFFFLPEGIPCATNVCLFWYGHPIMMGTDGYIMKHSGTVVPHVLRRRKFHNRKAIGEIGCCESWMAERTPLMDRQVVRASGYLSVYLRCCAGLFIQGLCEIFRAISKIVITMIHYSKTLKTYF